MGASMTGVHSWCCAPQCCARLLRRAHYPRQFGGGGGIQLFAVRSTQFGAGDMVVVMDHTILQTGYGFPPSCTGIAL